MPVSSRSSSSRALVAIGTGALLVLVVIFITGGFVIEAGPFRLSSRNPRTPLLVALLAWTAVALRSRSALTDSLAWLTRFLDRHAPAAAIGWRRVPPGRESPMGRTPRRLPTLPGM